MSDSPMEHDEQDRVAPQVRHGADAHGKAIGSPGVVSGNVVQVPVDVDANASGNTANVIGVGNAAFDNYAVERDDPS